MPFDGSQVNIYALRRAQLIDALRREMPKNFVWNFDTFIKKVDCGFAGCALGLMSVMFEDFTLNPVFAYEDAAKYLGIKLRTSTSCFSTYDWGPVIPTPKQVADKLAWLTYDLPAI